MILTREVPPEKIERCYRWCSEAFSHAGKKFTFPVGTDPTKTYQWRYLKSLVLRIDQYGLDEAGAKLFINTVAQYAAKHNLLSKGMAVFFQSNILTACKKILDQEQIKFDAQIDKLAHTYCWVQEHGCDFYYKPHPDAAPNLIEWYSLGHISQAYLLYSKMGNTAYLKHIKNYADVLPDQKQLYVLGLKLSENLDFLRKARTILGNDWRTE